MPNDWGGESARGISNRTWGGQKICPRRHTGAAELPASSCHFLAVTVHVPMVRLPLQLVCVSPRKQTIPFGKTCLFQAVRGTVSSWELEDFANPPLPVVFSCILSLHMTSVEGNATEVFPQRSETAECFHGSQRTLTSRSRDCHTAANGRQDSGLDH